MLKQRCSYFVTFELKFCFYIFNLNFLIFMRRFRFNLYRNLTSTLYLKLGNKRTFNFPLIDLKEKFATKLQLK